MRGRPRSAFERCRNYGSTPARAGPTAWGRRRPRSCREHPRACGADPATRVEVQVAAGAPPRVRGRHLGVAGAEQCGRSTPARAGPTSAPGSWCSTRAEHPRACGADSSETLTPVPTKGAPPRVRGRPARPPSPGTAAAGEHPCACGADPNTLTRPSALDGAPPRVRGRRRGQAPIQPRQGSTPARAGPTGSACSTPRASSEHPRACGADWWRWPPASGARGAPPRVRGRPAAGLHHVLRRGSTPARAGPTRCCTSCWGGRREHPRACGADIMRRLDGGVQRGAPPRVRGRPSRMSSNDQAPRSTPARAGPTTVRPALASAQAEHPRACGADFAAVTAIEPADGAPPRVRGRHPAERDHALDDRSTPARAGPTTARRPGRRSPAEHPRACGADHGMSDGDRVMLGAPPRVRGRPGVRDGRRDRRPGSTPARAGPTSPTTARRSRTPEHPRACGADTHRSTVTLVAVGAPPRVRGRRGQVVLGQVHTGSTPARAGPTSDRMKLRMRTREHPRACGADRASGPNAGRCCGAPPRVRGRLVGAGVDGGGGGSTPARAGPTRRGVPGPRSRREHPRACGADTS